MNASHERTGRMGWLLVMLGLSLGAGAQEKKTLSFLPDPTCRLSPWVRPIEQSLREAAESRGFAPLTQNKESALFSLQYFLVMRKEGEKMVFQLDGRLVDKQANRLLAQGTGVSEPNPDERAGREQAARQAGTRLWDNLFAKLGSGSAATEKVKGRRVMLQITLEGKLIQDKESVEQKVSQELKKFSPKILGSSDSSLSLVLHSDLVEKELARRIEKVLCAGGQRRCQWVVQAKTSLIVRVLEKGP